MKKQQLKVRDKPHARVYHDMMDTAAWLTLPTAAKLLWLDLRRQANSFNNGDLCCTIAKLKDRGWTSTKLYRAKFALISLGFIAETRPGSFGLGKRVCALYRFTDLETYEIPKLGITRGPATQDFARFQNAAEATAALKDGMSGFHEKARSRQFVLPQKKVTNRDLSSHESRPVKAKIKSRIVTNGQKSSHESRPVAESPNPVKTRTNKRSPLIRPH